MKNVLLYYSFGFALGGGEYLPLAFIAALQKTCNLTLAVDVAANILSRLLTDASFREEQRLHCAERAKTFTRQAYIDRQRLLLDSILK